MKKISLNFKEIASYAKKLINTPSPTGYTQKVKDYLIENAKSKNIDYKITKKGAVIYKFENKHNDKNIMMAAHLDTLGAMVKQVKKDKIKITNIGGYPSIYVIGDYCKIHTFDEKIYQGTILPENPAVHVNKDLKTKEIKIKDLYIRPDINLKNDQGLSDFIKVGNFVSFDPKFQLVNNFIKGRHMDDKSSAAILLHVADLLLSKIKNLNNNIYIFFNITEETGQGISGFPEIDDLLIVDMGVVGNNVEGDEYSVSICSKDSSGPYNYEIVKKLIKLSDKNEIKYKTDTFPYYGSDGSAALRAGNDIRVGLIGPGVSASHGYERTHKDGLINTAKLILEFIKE